jgi:transposase InsO family protein
VDIAGPFPTTHDGYKFILIFIDYLTKFVEAFPLRTTTTKRIAIILVEQIICRYGAPRALLSDLANNFVSKLARSVYNLLDIHKLNTSGYRPQTNGLVERFNSTLKTMIRMYVDIDQKNWNKFIPYCVFAYNTSRQETTKHSPYYMLFGRSATLPIDVMSTTEDEIYTNEDEFIQGRILRMRLAHKFAEDAHRKIHLKYLAKIQRRTNVAYKIGDKVYVRIYDPKLKIPKKEALLWHGPFLIVEVRPNGVNYVIKEAKPRARKLLLVHASNIKPFHVVQSDLRNYPGLDVEAARVEEEKKESQ